MSDSSQYNSRAFQTSARSRKRIIKPKKWLTVLLLFLLLLIGVALFFTVRYALKNGFGGDAPETTTEEPSRAQVSVFPSEEAGEAWQLLLLKEGLVLPLPA